jgi:cytochrome b
MPETKSVAAGQTAGAVRVWDLPVRLFHWTLVLLIVCSLVTGKLKGNWMTYHMWSGYAILALVLFRLVWGFIGSTYARFANFIYGPASVLRYAGGLARRKPPHYTGHNPLGGWMVIFLLVCVGLQAGTGLFANDDIATDGPLVRWISKERSDWLTTIHRYNFEVLLVLAGVHIAAALSYLFVMKENLIKPMFTGTKPAAGLPADAAARFTPLWIAIVVLGIAAAVVYGIVNYR